MEIRSERPSDTAAIHALTEQAFRDHPYSQGTEQYIVDALRKAGRLSVSFVAEIDGRIVGHVAVSPVSIADGSDGWYGLGPISVAPEVQRQGFGSALMTCALQALKEMGASGCVLVGDPDFYGRFGFKPDPKLSLPEAPPEYFLVLPFHATVPSGRVTFHDAFKATGP